jgi:hypothetical protein
MNMHAVAQQLPGALPCRRELFSGGPPALHAHLQNVPRRAFGNSVIRFVQLTVYLEIHLVLQVSSVAALPPQCCVYRNPGAVELF